MPHPFKTLAEANDAFAALNTENEGNKQKLASAESARDAFSADLETAKTSAKDALAVRDTALSQVTALTAERDTEKARADKADADFKSHKDGEPARLNSEVQRITAAQGIPKAVAALAEGQTSGKPDFSNLTGLEKAIAAHKASLSK